MVFKELSKQKLLFMGLVLVYAIIIGAYLIFMIGSDRGRSNIVSFILMFVLPSGIIFPIVGWKLFGSKKDKIE